MTDETRPADQPDADTAEAPEPPQGEDPAGPSHAATTAAPPAEPDPDALPAADAALYDPDGDPAPNPYTDGPVTQETGL